MAYTHQEPLQKIRDDLVFPNSDGGYTAHNGMTQCKFKPLCKKAGVEGITWHALRHFAVGCWIESGLSPKTMQTVAGHAALQITYDRNGHMFPTEDHHKVLDRISADLFG